MIKNKKELNYCLEEDRKALGINRKSPKLVGDEIWKFQILLRKLEYASNCLTNTIFKPYILFLKYKYKKISIKLGFTIPINVIKEGLSIAHYGLVVINGKSKIGKNCRIQEGVTIGATNGSEKAPIIGDNVFIGSGAKIIGDLYIASNVAIGAGSVVVKSVNEEGITVAGVPAKKVSNKPSQSNLLIR
jgi:serine O-acetyltransferase